jgi:SAM-dependent MidA family methyltransferase
MLRHKIEREIRERGPIPFSRYMELCLYDPELGYYSRNTEQFGKAGDFYTSSDVHAVFGRLMARQFEEMWRVLGSPAQIEILELGPGRGLFAQDVLDWSQKKFPEFFYALHYSLEERSPALRERVKATLDRHLAAGKASLCSGDGLMISKSTSSASPSSRPVIVFANEFFDALPVEVIGPQGELRVSEKEGRFAETWGPASPEELEFLDRYSVHPEAGERVEAPLNAQRYLSRIAATLQSGFIIAIDYGYTRQEQLAGRHLDTIAAYRQHSVSANPYESPGEQDITAHVNFTALAATAEQSGMHVGPLFTQSQFLLGIGEGTQFADAFEDCQLPQERAKAALQLKHLVIPADMGESFHVLIASKGVDLEQVSRLSGFSFGKACS